MTRDSDEDEITEVSDCEEGMAAKDEKKKKGHKTRERGKSSMRKSILRRTICPASFLFYLKIMITGTNTHSVLKQYPDNW